MNKIVKTILTMLIWLLEGVIVGFGAIMPGISGATLCVAFGMYLPIIEIASHPWQNIKKYWKMLAVFIAGAGIGFVGLSGAAGYLMELNSDLVVCAFIGFIIGTFPELWQDAGREGRSRMSYVAVAAGFAVMLAVLIALRSLEAISVSANIWGYLLCGVLWGLSFIVPGLSSSTLIIFLGLYQPMLDGISGFDMKVIIPIGVGIVCCVLLLSRGINAAYNKYFSAISHTIIGVVAATAVMIFPKWQPGGTGLALQLLMIPCGAVVSYILTRICAKLKK